MTANISVLIVGAGPTGLTLACELARRGQSVRIIEQNPEPRAGSRGKGLQPRTLEIFDDLGVVDRVLSGGTPYPRMRAHFGPFALPWSMMETSAKTEQEPYPNPWMHAQADTEAVLRARLADFGVQVEFGTTLQAFTQDRDGVRATLNDIATHARYLVGADGGRSFVRKTLGLALQGHTLNEPSAIVGDLYLDGLDRDHWHVWPRARGGLIALCPLPGGEKFQLAAAVSPGTPMPALDLASVQQVVARASSKIKVRGYTWLSHYHPQARMVDRYRVGRVFLAGDAAHVHPPTGAQGLNIGVQDAHNLGWKLAAVLDGAPDTLLDTYQDERMPVAQRVLNLSTALYQRAVKQRRGPETKQLGTSYRDSVLSVGEGAGDRAPDATTREGRLFDVFRGTHFTLLAFCAEAARMQSNDPRVRVFQADLRTARIYQAGSMVVVRPDGYIALRSDVPSAFELDEYLRRARTLMDREPPPPVSHEAQNRPPIAGVQ